MASSFHYLREHMKKEVFQKETFDLDLYIGFHTNFLWALGSLFHFAPQFLPLQDRDIIRGLLKVLCIWLFFVFLFSFIELNSGPFCFSLAISNMYNRWESETIYARA